MTSGADLPELDDARTGCHEAHARLITATAHLTDRDVRADSRLPGWTVGHVLTHVARNADSVVRRLAGAARGEIVDQYPGGAAGRAEIEEGAARPCAVLLADVVATAAAVEAAIAAMPVDAWGNLTRGVDGDQATAAHVVFSRWREVEVHHVDLGLGYEPSDWPIPLVERWLTTALDRLPSRADPQALLAWTLGRGRAPELQPWG